MTIIASDKNVSMNDSSPAPPPRAAIRVVDLVFAGEPRGRGRRLAIGAAIVFALYAGVFIAVNRLGRSASAWSAELAARVHDAIAVERALDIAPPPPPPSPAPEPAHSEPPSVAPTRVARTLHGARARPAAPAQAGKLAAVSDARVDFTGSAFAVGSAPTYAGGTTTSSGTGHTPARGAVAPGTGDGVGAARSRARAVALDQSAWNCPWPAEADAQQVNEQTVVLRVTVRPDGRADKVEVLSDPGFGFGAAARLCALRTAFDPARDPAGQPIAALSPPIRVHFFR
jgi:protein TonB